MVWRRLVIRTVRNTFLFCLVYIFATALPAPSQTTPVRYFYDDIGRLVRVVDQNGNVATYSYDSVGNIVAITRSTAPGSNGLAVFSFSPQNGPVGQTVVIRGQGFNTTPPSNTVKFNGVAATVSTATATALTVAVPVGATTGAITVTVGTTSATSDSNFTVLPATLLSIAVSPTPISIALGQQQQLKATGFYTGGTQQDITSSVTWSVVNPSIASISNTAGTQGLLTAGGQGITNIAATLNSITGVGTVKVRQIQSITVTPPPAVQLLYGASQQFTATGTYTDGSVENISSLASWNSATPSVASVTQTGLVTGVGVGVSSICASLPPTTNCTSVNVVASLVSVAITPSNPVIPKGSSQQLVAQGTFNDHSVQNISATVRWNSSATNIATVSNASGTNGLVNTVSVGTASITATVGAITNTTSVTVTPPVPIKISVTPDPAALEVGGASQLSASSVLTDGTSLDITNSSNWTSSDATVVTVSNSTGSKGQITAVTAGSATITAASGSLTGSSLVVVSSTATGSVPRFAYEFNGDGTVSIYSVDAITGALRPRGYVPVGSNASISSIAVDPQGRFLYVSDTNANGVWVYLIGSDGSLIGVPASPFASGRTPTTVAADSSGRFVYVSNGSDNTVSAFSVDPVSGALNSIAGSPFATGIDPISLSLDPSGKFAYVANARDNTVSVFAIDQNAGTLAEVGGSPFATGTNPSALTTDPSGQFLFVTNQGRNFGSGSVGLHHFDRSPFALNKFDWKSGASGTNSSAYQGAAQDWRLASLSISSSIPLDAMRAPKTFYGDSLFTLPRNLFLQSGGPSGPSVSVFAVDPNTGTLTQVAGSPFVLSSANSTPNAIVFEPTGRYLYVVSGNLAFGFAFDRSVGQLSELSDSPYTGGLGSSNAAADPSGKFLYMGGAEFSINAASGSLMLVRPYAARFGQFGIALTRGAAPVTYVPQFAYVVNSGTTALDGSAGPNAVSGYSIDPATGLLTALSGSPFGDGFFPELSTADPFNRFLYLSNDCSDISCASPTGSVSAYSIAPSSGILSPISGTPFSAGSKPTGIAADVSGRYVYTLNTQDNTISGYTIDSITGQLTPAQGMPLRVSATGPLALSNDPAGAIVYVSTQCTSGGSCSQGGLLLYSIVSGGGLFYTFDNATTDASPRSIAVDPTGHYIFVANNGSNTLSEIIASRFSAFSTVPDLSVAVGSPFAAGQGPTAVVVDPTGRFVYVTNGLSNDLSGYVLDPASGTLTPMAGSPFAAGANPTSITVDASGRFVYVTNEGDNTVSVFSVDASSGRLTPVAGSPIPVSKLPVSIMTTGKVQ